MALNLQKAGEDAPSCHLRPHGALPLSWLLLVEDEVKPLSSVEVETCVAGDERHAERQMLNVFILLCLFLMFLRPFGSKRPEVERILLFMGLRLGGFTKISF